MFLKKLKGSLAAVLKLSSYPPALQKSDWLTPAANPSGSCSSHLILPDQAVSLQRLPPAQTDLLFVAAAQDRIHRDGSWN